MARWALFVVVAACAGDKDPPGTPTGETGETAAPPGPPTFSRVLEHALAGCAVSGCHASAASDNGFSLEAGQAHDALVGAPSEFAAGEVLVIPGDPDGSYLIKKVDGVPGIVGDRMPPPLGGFDPRLRDELWAWIEAGALDN